MTSNESVDSRPLLDKQVDYKKYIIKLLVKTIVGAIVKVLITKIIIDKLK